MKPDDSYQLVNRVIDGVCGRNKPQYTDYSKVWSLEEWWQVTDAVEKICMDFGKNRLTQDEVRAKLSSLPDDYKGAIVESFVVRTDDIVASLVTRTNSVSHTTLDNFDWKVKLALAGDKLASIQQPLVTVAMDLTSGDVTSPTSIEMNKEELKMLITSLEAASKVVTQYTTH